MKRMRGILVVLAATGLLGCAAKVDCFYCTTRIIEKGTLEGYHLSEVYCGDQKEIELANTYEDELYMYSTICR